MNSFNNCTFIGRIPNHEAFKIDYRPGDQPAGHQYQQGQQQGKRSFYKATLSVKRAIKGKDDNYYKEDLIPITAFGQQADFMNQYVQRGMNLAVSGSLNVDTVSDQNGQKRTYYTVVVDNVRIINESRNADYGNGQSYNGNFSNFRQNPSQPPAFNQQQNGFSGQSLFNQQQQQPAFQQQPQQPAQQQQPAVNFANQQTNAAGPVFSAPSGGHGSEDAQPQGGFLQNPFGFGGGQQA